jgi:hypothetical protein
MHDWPDLIDKHGPLVWSINQRPIGAIRSMITVWSRLFSPSSVRKVVNQNWPISIPKSSLGTYSRLVATGIHRRLDAAYQRTRLFKFANTTLILKSSSLTISSNR